MTYEEFEAQISAYVEGELNSIEKTAMDHKAAECEKCRVLLDGVQGLTERLGQLPQEQPSAEFQFALRSHLLMEVANEQRMLHRARRVFFGSAMRTVSTMAAAVIFGLGLTSMIPQTPELPAITQAVVKDVEFNLVPGQTAPNHQGALERLSQKSYRLDSQLYRDHSVRLDTLQVLPPRISPWLMDQQGVKQIPASYSF